MWALTDFDEENGASECSSSPASSVSSFSRLILVCATALVVPGSHGWEKAERAKFFGPNLGPDSPLVAQAVMPIPDTTALATRLEVGAAPHGMAVAGVGLGVECVGPRGRKGRGGGVSALAGPPAPGSEREPHYPHRSAPRG